MFEKLPYLGVFRRPLVGRKNHHREGLFKGEKKFLKGGDVMPNKLATPCLVGTTVSIRKMKEVAPLVGRRYTTRLLMA